MFLTILDYFSGNIYLFTLDIDASFFFDVSQRDILRIFGSVSFATEFKHAHVDMIVGQRQNHNVWEKLICLILVKRYVQLVSYCVCLLVDFDEVFVVNGVTKSDLQVILFWLCSEVKSFLSFYLCFND